MCLNMVERPTPPSAQETSPLHEQGGITPDHWQEVLRTLPNGDTKIAQYAQAVIAGRIDDRGYTHREYLGERHWKEIRTLNTSKVPSSRLNLEIAAYSLLEEMVGLTLDDHYYYQRARDKFLYKVNNEKSLKWMGGKGAWRDYYRQIGQEETDKTGIFKGKIKRLLLYEWLLAEGEVEDPLHKSPEELHRFAREKVTEHTLKERLRDYQGERGLSYNRLFSYLPNYYHDLVRTGDTATRIWEQLYDPNSPRLIKPYWEFTPSEIAAEKLWEDFSHHFGYHPFIAVFHNGVHNHPFLVFHSRVEMLFCERRALGGILPEIKIIREGDRKGDNDYGAIPKINGWEKPVPQAA